MMLQGHEPARRFPVVLGAFVTVIMLVGAAQPLSVQVQKEKVEEYAKKLRSKQPRVRYKAADDILQDRNLLVDKLITLVDPANAKKHSYETRAAAAFVLGELRAVKAVSVLSKSMPEETGTLISILPRFPSPFSTALVKIGRPVVPIMIKNIEEISGDKLFIRTMSLTILCRVLGGKRQVLELLAKLETRAVRDKRKLQKIRAIITLAKKRYKGYKESREPLY